MIGAPSLLAVFLRRDWAIARSYRLNFGLELFHTVVSLVLFFYLSESSTTRRSRHRHNSIRATSRSWSLDWPS